VWGRERERNKKKGKEGGRTEIAREREREQFPVDCKRGRDRMEKGGEGYRRE
jgi:hypothetical protein